MSERTKLSRRSLLRSIGAGAAATVALPSMEASLGAARSEGPIRLHRNEGAYGPSRVAVAAMEDAAAHNGARYPDVEMEALRTKIAKRHGVSVEQVVLGGGSREIMRRVAEAFLGPGRTMISAVPTFDYIGRYARSLGAEVVAVPLTREHAHDLDAMLARSGATTGLVYICNPNNPTGTLTRRPELESFLRRLPATAHVLIDEAYANYVAASADYASFIDRPIDDPRLIVTRTFSNVYGLAGARVGYAVSAPQTVRLLASDTLADDLNVLGVAAAFAALDDFEHVRLNVQRNADERQEFFNQANARMLRGIDSQTNFVLLNTGRPAADMVAHFKSHDVLVSGPFASFDTSIRVSIGTTAEMREFWRVWDLLPVQHQMAM